MSEIDSGADWRPIERLLYAYAGIVDQRKWELMDSVFAPDATIDYTRTGGKKGPYRPTLESPGAASVPPTRRFLQRSAPADHATLAKPNPFRTHRPDFCGPQP